MADICVIYASEDEAIVEKLVTLLRREWDVWWGEDITQGDWEKEARSEIEKAQVVLPVLSRSANSKAKFRGELELACSKEKRIFPFLIEDAEVPLSIGHYNRTNAFGWNGDEGDKGFQALRRKIALEVPPSKAPRGGLQRVQELHIRGKTLRLPCFVFSVSSHETQVRPVDGIALFRALTPPAGLVSAYDAWQRRKDQVFSAGVKQLKESNCTLFLDSGNYEAFRKNDRRTNENKDGWSKNKFRKIAAKVSPDIAFAFDTTDPKGDIDQVAKAIITNFHADERAISGRDFPLCPIVHVPKIPRNETRTVADYASSIVASVAAELSPTMVAIPERELGDGLRERIKTVRRIRSALNALGRYYPLHLLGTGNPITVLALAVAGADSFDGLEWCRTVADYDNGRLFHFQHFDFFRDLYLGRLQQKTREAIESPKLRYNGKVAAYNMDFFNNWTRTVQDMIHSGQEEHLLKSVSSFGATLFRDLTE